MLKAVPSIDIVAHRIVWSLLVSRMLSPLARAGTRSRAAIANRKTLAMLLLTALLIGTNWLLYVYAINSGHILAGSLGYYLNPLANILLGRFILKERLTRLQWAAVAIAAAGIAVLAAGALGTLVDQPDPVLQLRHLRPAAKIVHGRSLAGLTIETAILFPVALGWLLLGGVGAAGRCSARRRARPACWCRRHRLDEPAAAASPPPPGASLIRPSACCSSSRRPCSSCSRSLLYDEALHTRPRHRLRLHLDGAGTLRDLNDPRLRAPSAKPPLRRTCANP